MLKNFSGFELQVGGVLNPRAGMCFTCPDCLRNIGWVGEFKWGVPFEIECPTCEKKHRYKLQQTDETEGKAHGK